MCTTQTGPTGEVTMLQ